MLVLAGIHAQLRTAPTRCPLQDSGIPVPQHIIVNRDHLPPGQPDPGGHEGNCGETHHAQRERKWRACLPRVPLLLPGTAELPACLPPALTAEGFVETEDYVELGDVRICKPFVEKPASGGWVGGSGGGGVY